MATKPMRGPAGRAMHATERPKNTGKTMRRTMAFILKHYTSGVMQGGVKE